MEWQILIAVVGKVLQTLKLETTNREISSGQWTQNQGTGSGAATVFIILSEYLVNCNVL